MNQQTINMIEGKLYATLDEHRFLHSRSVAFTAATLAMRWYKGEMDRVMIAGYMHDCAKCKSIPEMLSAAEEWDIFNITEFHIQNPQLLHAMVGPAIAQAEYGIFDREIHDAISTHTTGAPKMSIMQKIIYVADFIEPVRDTVIKHIENYREAAFTDIDKAVYMIAQSTVDHITSKGVPIDPVTVATRDYYKKLIEERDGISL
ncbi:MAG: bis(5'-nucleosyl)-tetraphosphatase (symmetrical) YqeK [Parasporobacterium sp.]|nr:bis(5'-nucleosyl)-tetraphosphatase (symmetrical) YqeK [Parasporobacterium sp.]